MDTNQQQMGERLGAIWRHLAFVTELALSTFPPQKGVHGYADCSGWQSVLQALARRVGATTGAGEVRLCLKLAEKQYLAVSPSHSGLPQGPLVIEDVFEPTRLAVPILASGEWIGSIDVGKPSGGEFTTQDKKLLQTTAALLGLAADRALLLRLQASFATHVVQDHKVQSMLHQVWALTNNGSSSFQKTVDSVISAVRRAVPCGAVITRLWDHNGEKLHELQDAASPKLLALLNDAVSEVSEQALSSGTVWARRYPLAQDGLDDNKPRSDSAAFAGAVIIIPLRRVRSAQGVLALARDGQSPEFSTEEKQALCVVSGLLNALNGA